jgi:amidohydrolase
MTAMSFSPSSSVLADAGTLLPELISIRRRLHRHPELGLELPETQETVLGELERLGLDSKPGKRIGSVTAVIGARKKGPTTILRADMDALPLTEVTGLDFASEVPGKMHACGHDTHVAMLLGAAHILVERQDELQGPVVLMFQPGEEGFFGARAMIEEGLLKGLDVKTTRAFAIHISTRYPSGHIYLRPGALLASADNFEVTIHGRGGHASAPHFAQDPIVVAAELIGSLQTLVTREIDVFDPAIITVANVVAGTTNNIIPESAWLRGTYRTISDTRRAFVGPAIQRLAEGLAAAHGMRAEVGFSTLYPVTINDAGVAAKVQALAAGLIGEAEVVTMAAPVMGAEDFSYVLQKVPGTMVFLGGRAPDVDPKAFADNHSDKVVFDESAMAVGAALHAEVALRLER